MVDRPTPPSSKRHGPWREHKVVIKLLLTAILVTGLLFMLTGCSYITALGGDSSTLTVERECKVNIAQAAHVAGREESSVAETVRINERCEVEVDFEQQVEEQRMEGSLLENAVGRDLE